MILAAIGAQELELIGVGTAAGLLGGLLGIGGGIVMIPAMVFVLGQKFGPESFHVYKLAAISTSFVLSFPACYRHIRAGAMVRAMLPGIIIAGLLGVVAGVLTASTFVGEHTATLRRIFGAFLQLVVLINVWQASRAASSDAHLCRACPMPHRWLRSGPLVGLPAGFIAGLLGVGGGVWAVPSQRMLLGIRVRNAIANSAGMILFVSLFTAAGLSWDLATRTHGAALHRAGWWLALWLAPGAIVGGYLGAGLTHRLPTRWLRWGFQVLLVITGVKLMME